MVEEGDQEKFCCNIWIMNIEINIFAVATLKFKKYISWQLHTYTVEIEIGTPEKSDPGTRQTDGKNLVWFGEKERKLAKLSMPISLLTVLPLNYFMGKIVGGRKSLVLYNHSILSEGEHRRKITTLIDIVKGSCTINIMDGKTQCSRQSCVSLISKKIYKRNILRQSSGYRSRFGSLGSVIFWTSLIR